MKSSTVNNQLSADVILKVVAIHKATLKEFETTMTYSEWMTFKRDRKYNYKAIQI
jgi:hypothetical protein